MYVCVQLGVMEEEKREWEVEEGEREGEGVSGGQAARDELGRVHVWMVIKRSLVSSHGDCAHRAALM